MNWNLRMMPVAGALLVAGLALPMCARAQSSPPSPPPAPAQVAPPAVPGGNPTMDDQVGKRITQLHAALHITADEEGQWKQFADTMRDNTRKMDEDYKDRATKFASLNAFENMQSYAQIAQEHAEDVQRLVTAFEPLYTAMPDAQKKIADDVFRNVAAKHVEQH
jgi:periplasmic protein CpxP/Spy